MSGKLKFRFDYPRKLRNFNEVSSEASFNAAIPREREGTVGSQRSFMGNQEFRLRRPV